MDYYAHKKTMSEAAKAHHLTVSKECEDQIRWSTEHTIVYGGVGRHPQIYPASLTPSVFYLDADTVRAAALASQKFAGKKIAVLDFASYQNPGGKYMEGSSAQEEMLCHASTLYECLEAQKNYYDWNRQHKNRALYTDRALYVPSVLFNFRDYRFKADVIACAAPNRTVYMRYFSSEPNADMKNTNALRSRIAFIKAIAEENHVDVFISGAFGCGVFGQDQDEVAREFYNAFHTSSVSTVIFAAPAGINAKNAEAFRKVFGRPRTL